MNVAALQRVTDEYMDILELFREIEYYRPHELPEFFDEIKNFRIKIDTESGKSYFDILRDANIFTKMFIEALSVGKYLICNFMIELVGELGNYILRNKSEKEEALLIACSFGRIEIVQFILSDRTFSPPVEDAFRQACFSGNIELVNLFMTRYSYFPSSNVSFNSVIIYASSSKNTELVKFLLKEKGLGYFTLETETLNEVAIVGNTEMCFLLLDYGAIPDNHTFINACITDKIELIHHLLEKYRIDPAAEDNLAFREACKYEATEVVRFLLTVRGIDPAARNNEGFRLACKTGNLELVRMLLSDRRIDPTTENNEALNNACRYSNIEVVRALLDDYRLLRIDISEALRIATENRNVAIIRLLKDHHLKLIRLNIDYVKPPSTGYNFETLEDENVEYKKPVHLAEFGMPVGYEEPDSQNVVQFLVNGQSLLLSRDYLESIVSDKGDRGSWFYECTGRLLDNGNKRLGEYSNTPYILIPLHYQIFVHRDTLRRVLQLNLKTVKVVPVLNPDGTHKSFSHSISWSNAYGPEDRRNFISASHCQQNSNINIYDLVTIHKVHPYKMEPVGGLAGYGKKQLHSKRHARRSKRHARRKQA